MKNHYLIIGQGEIGLSLAVKLSNMGHRVTGLARTPKNYPDGNVQFWQKDALSLTAGELAPFTHIAIIITPSKNSDRVQAYRDSYLAVCEHLARLAGEGGQGSAKALPNLRQILFVSSTSVYGENSGEIIDETTPIHPKSGTARILHQAELALQNQFGEKCVIARPSGIYGADRLRLVRLANTAHLDGASATAMTNRIMDSDLVNVLANILISDNAKPVYLATDFCPVSSFDVLTFICQKMGYLPPKHLNPPPSGKVIRSNLPEHWLQFHDYKQGYDEILKNRP